MKKVKILFVCMGNICRSPTALGVMRGKLNQAGLSEYFQLDSAGTHAFHEGELPDRRAQAAARQHGVDISDLRARLLQPGDFFLFDYILGMDRDNYARLHRRNEEARGLARIGIVMAYAKPGCGEEIGDPYFGGPRGFERVLNQLDAACTGLITTLCRRHGIGLQGEHRRV